MLTLFVYLFDTNVSMFDNNVLLRAVWHM